MELIFEVRDAEEGGYCARALGHPIFTQGETWKELRANVAEATSLHFEDGPVQPRLVQLHYTRTDPARRMKLPSGFLQIVWSVRLSGALHGILLEVARMRSVAIEELVESL
ncbi:MAG TPA: hypothetical protein VJN43_16725 [Bryobacteraceae bacterium]|nr:hypothetical protein [Bryobacteraceae bacterium]